MSRMSELSQAASPTLEAAAAALNLGSGNADCSCYSGEEPVRGQRRLSKPITKEEVRAELAAKSRRGLRSAGARPAQDDTARHSSP